MESVSSAIGTLAALLLILSIVWFVVLGFRRGFLWGLFTIFLFPIAAIIIVLNNISEAAKPLIIFGASTVLVAISTSDEMTVLFLSGFVILGAIILYTRVDGGLSLSITLPSRRKVIVDAEGVVFDSKRFNETVQREHAVISQFKGKPKANRIAKLLKDPELAQDINRFVDQKFWELSQGALLGPKVWKQQDVELFLLLAKDKHGMEYVDTVASLIYTCDEKGYAKFTDFFAESSFGRTALQLGVGHHR
ncbi:MAG: hypothetical protein GY759_18645 [Chloroflexi bacterium]|nr:hypothetical protein [Chloroflexota bacterium]